MRGEILIRVYQCAVSRTLSGGERGWMGRRGEERRFKTLEKELIVFPVKEGYIWTTHNPRRLAHTNRIPSD